MNESIYLTDHYALINFTKAYHQNNEELINSDNFDVFLDAFMQKYAKLKPEICKYLCQGHEWLDIKNDVKRLLKMLIVLELDEIDHPLLKHREMLLQVIEDAYLYYRKLMRISYIYTRNDEGLQIANFIEADDKFNQMVLHFYRTIQEKIQGSKNFVYRQMQAGTNASLLLMSYAWELPQGYEGLKGIPFINRMMLRTPLLIHSRSNKRTGMFSEKKVNPITEFSKEKQNWMCYPCHVGELLVFIYFHRDFVSSVLGLGNLFQLASEEECLQKKPDAILLFGNPDGTEDTVYHYDQENQFWIGKVSYNEKIEYFGYLKKMTLTLHNLAMQQKGYLPLHGAMLNLGFKDGTRKSVIFIGDSGAGKSETIEALVSLGSDEIEYTEIVFDDMGILRNENNQLVAQGTEIGAFVRLDDLDKGSAYRDMNRSIFFNPESSNARVVIPTADYDVIVKKHSIDMFLYANNYTDERGIRKIENLEEAKQIFVEGKRFALGTTQEKGLSTTYFANPFGPMQQQELCDPIINQMFKKLFDDGIYVGEIYSCLGLEDKGDNGIMVAAQALLDEIKKV